MATATVQCDVVSNESSIFSGEVEMGVFPGEAGELGILPRHTPLLTRIKPGVVRLKLPEQNDFFVVYVSGGMLEVQPDMITVLADTAVRAKDLDEAKKVQAQQASEAAQKDQQSNLNYARAEAELSQVISQLQNIKNNKNPR